MFCMLSTRHQAILRQWDRRETDAPESRDADHDVTKDFGLVACEKAAGGKGRQTGSRVIRDARLETKRTAQEDKPKESGSS